MGVGVAVGSGDTRREPVLFLSISEHHSRPGASPALSVRSTPLTSRYRTQLVAQLLTFPLGRLLARVVPGKRIFGVSLNPGPFSIKEHVVVTIMAGVGATSAYAVRDPSSTDPQPVLITLQRRTLLPYNDSAMTKCTALGTSSWS